jgi:hypothetical protein
LPWIGNVKLYTANAGTVVFITGAKIYAPIRTIYYFSDWIRGMREHPGEIVFWAE